MHDVGYRRVAEIGVELRAERGDKWETDLTERCIVLSQVESRYNPGKSR